MMDSLDIFKYRSGSIRSICRGARNLHHHHLLEFACCCPSSPSVGLCVSFTRRKAELAGIYCAKFRMNDCQSTITVGNILISWRYLSSAASTTYTSQISRECFEDCGTSIPWVPADRKNGSQVHPKQCRASQEKSKFGSALALGVKKTQSIAPNEIGANSVRGTPFSR